MADPLADKPSGGPTQPPETWSEPFWDPRFGFVMTSSRGSFRILGEGLQPDPLPAPRNIQLGDGSIWKQDPVTGDLIEPIWVPPAAGGADEPQAGPTINGVPTVWDPVSKTYIPAPLGAGLNFNPDVGRGSPSYSGFGSAAGAGGGLSSVFSEITKANAQTASARAQAAAAQLSADNAAAARRENAELQRELLGTRQGFEGGENALDRAVRANEFAQTHGLNVEQLELARQRELNQARNAAFEQWMDASTAIDPAAYEAFLLANDSPSIGISRGQDAVSERALALGATALANVRGQGMPGLSSAPPVGGAVAGPPPVGTPPSGGGSATPSGLRPPTATQASSLAKSRERGPSSFGTVAGIQGLDTRTRFGPIGLPEVRRQLDALFPIGYRPTDAEAAAMTPAERDYFIQKAFRDTYGVPMNDTEGLRALTLGGHGQGGPLTIEEQLLGQGYQTQDPTHYTVDPVTGERRFTYREVGPGGTLVDPRVDPQAPGYVKAAPAPPGFVRGPDGALVAAPKATTGVPLESVAKGSGSYTLGAGGDVRVGDFSEGVFVIDPLTGMLIKDPNATLKGGSNVTLARRAQGTMGRMAGGLSRDVLSLAGDAPLSRRPDAGGARPEILFNPTRAPLGIVSYPQARQLFRGMGQRFPGGLSGALQALLAQSGRRGSFAPPTPPGESPRPDPLLRSMPIGYTPVRRASGTMSFFNLFNRLLRSAQQQASQPAAQPATQPAAPVSLPKAGTAAPPLQPASSAPSQAGTLFTTAPVAQPQPVAQPLGAGPSSPAQPVDLLSPALGGNILGGPPISAAQMAEIEALRSGVQYRELNPFDPRFFTDYGPVTQARWALGRQARYGIPTDESFFEAQRFRMPGLSFNDLRLAY